MSEFGSIYAKYYDLLYKDKDYEAEVEYVDSLIKRYNPTAKNILDLGCGTGRHAELLCRKGYHVHGVDASEDMIKIAKERQCQGSGSLKFTHSKIQNLNLSEKFDVIVALFHVLSYQTTNEDVLTFFKVASN
ncbi:MAG: class I SAM-dependent methyltransferase, partial [Calditerrivibrio sp.]|nr:class I SAM-dependent methyltransferase [Calditerrivibrio sp.]